MKFKSLTSLLISAAMAASCMSGLAVTASAEEGSYTVSIGTITGGSIGDVMLVDPTATLAPTAAPEQTASPVTGLVPITESYAFIADNFTAAGAAAVAADTFFDGGKVYSALGNTVASNKQKSVINGTEYFNSLRLKGSQNYLEFIVGVNAEITVYSNIQNQSGKERAVAAGTTAGGTDMGHGEVEDGFFTFSAAAGTKVYLTGVNASDWATGGDMYIAGFTVTPAESMGAASVEASGAEALVSTLKANEGDTITVKAEDKALYDLTISTVPDVTVTAVEGKTGYYSFTMPAADTTVNAEYTANADKLPADQAWTSLDADLMAAASAAADGAAFGPVNGISGYGKWTNQASTAAYTHTNGVTYNFTSAFRAGSGGPTKRSFCFTPQQACIVTVAYTAQAGRPVYIYQGGTLLASGEDSAVNGVAATITADIEDPAAGDVIIYGGSSNKDIYGIFADYYDPSIVTYRNLSGNVIYSGAADTSALKLVFKDTKDGT
ncbi:MAG: hypothetical protein ACI4TH_03270, partial [Candidatus Ornithomonoglobus sp.]